MNGSQNRMHVNTGVSCVMEYGNHLENEVVVVKSTGVSCVKEHGNHLENEVVVVKTTGVT